MRKNLDLNKIILLSFSIVILLIAQTNPGYAEDKFQCFTRFGNENCTNALDTSKKCVPTYDYTIRVNDGIGDGVVLSIHGGLIEPYTSELAGNIAKKLQWKHYDFAGHTTSKCSNAQCPTDLDEIRKSNFKNLHITSTKFNDERALELVNQNFGTISVHAYSRSRTDDKTLICVGGRNDAVDSNPSIENNGEPNEQAARFIEYINERDESDLQAINARDKSIVIPCGKVTSSLQRLSGSSSRNITNRNSRKEGLQLEFHLDLLADIATETNNNTEENYQEAILNAVDYATKIE